MRRALAPRLRATIAAAIAFGLGVPLACSGKVASPPETKADTGATATATATGTPEKCAACVDARCKATWDACQADATCIAQTDCIAACTDAECEARCKTSHASTLGDATQACFR